MMGEDVALEPIFITGSGYRKAQLRGYQLYQRFLSSIITDTTKLIYMHQLEMFLKRNLPKVYALKHDYNYVSDDVIESYYGVTESEAVDHYSRLFLVWRNNRRRDKTPKMYEKYVKAPLVSDGIRLDTVYRSGGEFVYEYVQPVTVRRGLRKVDVTISGDIYEQDRKIYDIPKSEPLTFYISSFSTLLENKVVYKDAVVERRVDADMTYFVDFEKGRAEVKEGYMDNASEIARIKSTLSGLLASDVFALDSVSVSAYASPEGGEALNRSLSGRRSASVGEYFGRYMKHVRDSVLAEGFNETHHQAGGHDGGQDGNEDIAGGLEDFLPPGHLGSGSRLDIRLGGGGQPGDGKEFVIHLVDGSCADDQLELTVGFKHALDAFHVLERLGVDLAVVGNDQTQTGGTVGRADDVILAAEIGKDLFRAFTIVKCHK